MHPATAVWSLVSLTALAALGPKSFKSFFLTTLAAITYLYVFALFDILQVGLWAFHLVGTFLAFYKAYTDMAYRKILLTALLGGGVLYFIFSSSWFLSWDEFTHWGVAIKWLNLKDSLPTSSDPVPYFYYPPGLPLWQYLFIGGRNFLEGTAFFAHSILILAGLAVLVPTRWPVKWPMLFALFFVVLELEYKASLRYLYADHVLAVIFAATLVLIKNKSKDEVWWPYVLPCFVLGVIKPYSFLFGLVIVGFLALNRLFKASITGFAALAVAYLSWGKLYGKSGSFSKVAKGFKETFSGARTEFDLQVFEAFQGFLAEQFFAIFLPLVVLAALYFFLTRKKDGVGLELAYLFLGLLGYMTFLFLSYLYLFSEYEALRLASFRRYLGSYTLGLQLYLLSQVIRNFPPLRFKRVGFAFGGALIIASILMLERRLPNLGQEDRVAHRQEIKEIVADVEKSLGPRDSVLILMTKDNGLYRQFFEYEFLPRAIKTSSIGGPYHPSEDIWTKDISLERLTELVKDVDYVFVYRSDEAFWKRYAPLFEEQKQRSLYRVKGPKLIHLWSQQ